DAQLKKGLLEICVLKSIEEKESYGYKIISDLAPYVEISESTLYPILKRLENEKSVTVRAEAYNGRLRKYFSITEKGKEKIFDFLEDLEEWNKIVRFVIGGKR
ncbi:MAG: PadR family transcriptional regulator, partial [Clostridia bacterium]|nr:PadR family transcriptional regulator [Clostridia bacterium]